MLWKIPATCWALSELKLPLLSPTTACTWVTASFLAPICHPKVCHSQNCKGERRENLSLSHTPAYNLNAFLLPTGWDLVPQQDTQRPLWLYPLQLLQAHFLTSPTSPHILCANKTECIMLFLFLFSYPLITSFFAYLCLFLLPQITFLPPSFD